MRKKLGTRFPASRIKKIMQADEDVGKIAMAVPVLVSKALELFLQDLCDKTYEITLQRGAKTMNSLHLKHCIQMYSAFDFLRESVSKVPDIGGSDHMGIERHATRRRKVLNGGDSDATEEGKRAKTGMVTNHVGRGRGGGRGRGRPPRNSRLIENDARLQKYEDDDLDMPPEDADNMDGKPEKPEEHADDEKANVECTHNGMDAKTSTESLGSNHADDGTLEKKMEVNHEYLGWPLYGMANMNIEPTQLLHLHKRSEPEPEEDYDNDEE